MCPGCLQMLQVTTLFLLAGGSSVEVPVQTEVAALESSATFVDGFGSEGFGQVMSAASVDLQCCECCHIGNTASECLVQE